MRVRASDCLLSTAQLLDASAEWEDCHFLVHSDGDGQLSFLELICTKTAWISEPQPVFGCAWALRTSYNPTPGPACGARTQNTIAAPILVIPTPISSIAS
mmetsp:Transcript_87646/g.183270  ORF Transcript_87646/g.183270 Transcript_87646/m.183270 type:complete len:100 (-) Transcript_87646:49-348(-)